MVMVVFAFLASVFVLWDRGRLTPERMESLIAAELPPGIGREKVERWAIAVARRNPNRCCVCVPGHKLPSAIARLAIEPQGLESAIVLSVPAARLNLVSSEDMFVYFLFDTDHRLRAHHIALRQISY